MFVRLSSDAWGHKGLFLILLTQNFSCPIAINAFAFALCERAYILQPYQYWGAPGYTFSVKGPHLHQPPPRDQAPPRTRQPPVDRHTPVNILLCPKLRLRAVTRTDLLESRSRECSDGRVGSLQVFQRGSFPTYNDTFQSDVSRQMIQGWHLRVLMCEIKEVIKELTVDGRYLSGYVISLMIMMIFKAKFFSIFDLFAWDSQLQLHTDKVIEKKTTKQQTSWQPCLSSDIIISLDKMTSQKQFFSKDYPSIFMVFYKHI